MSNEISSDVKYLIDQLDEMKHKCSILDITYGDVKVDGTTRLTKENTQQQPNVNIKRRSEDKIHLTLIMIDPDAPSAEQPITGPFVHWILTDFEERNETDGKILCPYMGPGPRPGTGTHRYIFLLYESKEQVVTEKRFNDIPQRRKFPLLAFVSTNHLELVDVTLFNVEA